MSGTRRYVRRVPLTFTEVLDPAAELDAMAQFLCAHEWPFHGTPRLTPTEVAEMAFGPPDVATFCIGCDGERVGLLRLLDLTDLADGSPLFDLRIAASRRGREAWPDCERTRHDAMIYGILRAEWTREWTELPGLR